jgi:hypothetical protein
MVPGIAICDAQIAPFSDAENDDERPRKEKGRGAMHPAPSISVSEIGAFFASKNAYFSAAVTMTSTR